MGYNKIIDHGVGLMKAMRMLVVFEILGTGAT